MSDEHEKHHILSNKIGLAVFIGLLILTVVTVAASRVDFGALNFGIAMLIATSKALLVMLFFMGLKYDERDNKLFFFFSFLFIGFFVALTAADTFTRQPNWRNTGSHLKEVVASGPSKFKKAWISTDELKARGKEVYQGQCVVCHGADGRGDGPAAAAMNPKPRNFHNGDGWINGRKVAAVFLTLKNGVNSMPAFNALPADDRWAVTHYVLSLGGDVPASNDGDLKKAGIVDPSKDDGGVSGAVAKRTIPVDFAIDLYISSQKNK